MIALGLALFNSITVPVCVWIIFNGQRTLDDRLKSLRSMQGRIMSFGPLLIAYETVTFMQHMRARLLCRDPWALYDPMILDAIKNPQTDLMGMVRVGEPEEAPPAVH